MAMRPKLVAFGNVLLDFTYCIEKNPSILLEYGFESDGVGECSSETLSAVGINAEKTCEFLSSQTGGSALNSSKILSLLGETEHVFCGAIGNDTNGLIVQQQLDKSGLKSCLQIVEGQPTGTCVCLINKENRSCYANIGASIYFNKEFLYSQDLIESNTKTNSCQIFYIEGYFITGERFTVCKHIAHEICQSSNGLRILAVNLSGEYIVKNHPQHIKYLVEHATILFGNRDEFTELAEIYQKTNVKELIAYLINDDDTRQTTDKIIICTQGSDSVLYSSRSQMIINKEFQFQAVPKDKIIDTTGCGDAFVAGFFYAFLRNESIESCVSKGVEVALKKITSVGGTLSK